MKKIIVIILFMVASNSCVADAKAELYLSKMLEKYQSLSLYVDSGISVTEYIREGKHGLTDKIEFSTKYSKGGSLYFHWASLPSVLNSKSINPPGYKEDDLGRPNKNVVWKDNTGVFSRYSFGADEQHAGIESALSSANGVSSGLSWMVPRYLSPEIVCAVNLGAESTEILTSTNNTIVIKLSHTSGRTNIMYINKKTNLLEKYESIIKINQTTYNQTVNYKIEQYK